MPDIAPELLACCPVIFRNTVRNLIRRIVLIAAHNLQYTIRIIGHRIEADHLMCHRNRQQPLDDLLPVIDRIIIQICPVEIEVRIEPSIWSRICEIQRLLRIHRDEYLHQGEQACEDTLMCILHQLVHRFLHIHTRALQFDMEDRHTVDEQHQIAATILQHLLMARKKRLFHDLVAALTCCDFHTIIDLQADFFSVVKRILLVLASDGNGTSIDKAIQRQRRTKRPHLLDQLIHFFLDQRAVVQTIDIAVIFKKNIRPVLNQILLCRTVQHLLLPAIALERRNHRLFKISFFIKMAHTSISRSSAVLLQIPYFVSPTFFTARSRSRSCSPPYAFTRNVTGTFFTTSLLGMS